MSIEALFEGMVFFMLIGGTIAIAEDVPWLIPTAFLTLLVGAQLVWGPPRDGSVIWWTDIVVGVIAVYWASHEAPWLIWAAFLGAQLVWGLPEMGSTVWWIVVSLDGVLGAALLMARWRKYRKRKAEAAAKQQQVAMRDTHAIRARMDAAVRAARARKGLAN